MAASLIFIVDLFEIRNNCDQV